MLSSNMLSLEILGVELYYIINWFWIYSFIGWIWESSFVSVKSHKLVNRGFVSGPALTIYGCGAVAVYLIMRPFSSNILALFFGGIVVATVLEYLTGVLMEAIFHANWWDYSDKKINFQGKICLGSSIGWGFFTLVLFYVFQPFVESVVSLYSRSHGEVAVNLITMIYCVDFGMSAFAAFHIKDKLKSMDKTWEEFVEYLQKSKLFDAASRMKGRSEALLHEYSGEGLRGFFEERKKIFSMYLDRLGEENEGRKAALLERRDEYMEKFDHFVESYLKDKLSSDRITRRYMKAYPNLALSAKKRAARKKNRELRKKNKTNKKEDF